MDSLELGMGDRRLNHCGDVLAIAEGGEVVKQALAANAAAVILAHNHPSGVAEPSQADRQLTQRLKDALALIDVRVLDHFIVGDGEPLSMAEYGWM